MGERFIAGGRLYTFGNGGSSTDAATLAGLFCDPPAGRAVPAWSLTDDQAVVTALGNDVGFELIFSRQIIAHSSGHDIAIALSTSGNSDDLLRGLSEAKRRGLLTIGFAGYDGGQMVASNELDFCFTVDSQSIHRIQESHARIGHRLWQVAQQTMSERRRELRAERAVAITRGADR
jgi:D-sedoheptulose 7-phosphate isomerase